MKDILRIIKFDYYVAAPTALPATLLSIFVVSIVSLLAFPGASSYLAFVAMSFVIPLQGAAEKKGFARIKPFIPNRCHTTARYCTGFDCFTSPTDGMNSAYSSIT